MKLTNMDAKLVSGARTVMQCGAVCTRLETNCLISLGNVSNYPILLILVAWAEGSILT